MGTITRSAVRAGEAATPPTLAPHSGESVKGGAAAGVVVARVGPPRKEGQGADSLAWGLVIVGLVNVWAAAHYAYGARFLLADLAASEKTAAAAGKVGEVRFDPFAMLPFCGYNIGDYIAHWLEIGEASSADKLPTLFWVNWFRKGHDGKFLWPGYGDNSRVLKWVLERVAGGGDATETPIGFVPTLDGIDTAGLNIDDETMREVLAVDSEAWREEVPLIDSHFAFTAHAPQDARSIDELEKRLRRRLATRVPAVGRSVPAGTFCGALRPTTLALSPNLATGTESEALPTFTRWRCDRSLVASRVRLAIRRSPPSQRFRRFFRL